MAKKSELKRLYLTMIQDDRLLFFANSKNTGFLAVDYNFFTEKKLLRETVKHWFSKGTKVLGAFADVSYEMPNGLMKARCYLLDGGYPLKREGIRPVFMGQSEFAATNPFPLEKELLDQALLYAPIFFHPIREIPLLEEDALDVQEKVEAIEKDFMKSPSQYRDHFVRLTESGSSLKRIRKAYDQLCERYHLNGKSIPDKTPTTMEVIP